MSEHNSKMFFPRRLHSHLIIFALAAAASAPSAMARRPNHLVLATSAEDPVLRARISGLSPTVNPEEARRVASIAYTTGRELAVKWDMVSSPTMQSFLINIGARKGGYCYQFAEQLLWRLEAQNLKTLEFHWGESDAGTDTEHNVIVVTARGQPFAQGLMLDNWRHSGHLLWGPLEGDPDHTWQENKDAFNSRVKRRPPTVDRHRQEKKPKHKRKHRPPNDDSSRRSPVTPGDWVDRPYLVQLHEDASDSVMISGL
jgi:hypothetical protein